MKYYIIFSCAIALCCAATLDFPNKEITVDENGITISVPGKTIKFAPHKNDNKTVEVVVKDENGLYKTIQIGNDKQIVREMTYTKEVELPEDKKIDTIVSRTRRSEFNNTQVNMTQMLNLVDIFKKYNGVVEEDKFQNLLKDLEEAVANNKINPVVLDVVKKIEDKNVLTQPILDEKLNATKLENVDVDGKNNTDSALNISQETLSKVFGINTNISMAELEQLVIKNSIWQIKEQIMNQQVAAKKLQYQQQFINKEKQIVELKLKMYEQLGMPEIQSVQLRQAQENLQKREEELLDIQIAMHSRIEKLHQQLLVQMSKMQQSIKDEYEIKTVV